MDWKPSPGGKDPAVYRDLMRLADALQSPQIKQFSQTVIADATARLNTHERHAGMMIWDTTNGRPLWSAGGSPTDVWVNGIGATTITPA